MFLDSLGIIATTLGVTKIGASNTVSEFRNFPWDALQYVKEVIESDSSNQDFSDKATTTLFHYNVALDKISQEYDNMISSMSKQIKSPKIAKSAIYAALYWADSQKAYCTLSILPSY